MALDLSNIKSIVGLSGKTIKEVRAKSGKVLWKAGAIVTYMVDSGVTKYEEVDTGASCLAPTTFTPAKSGWTFVGWRKDTTASASVESNVVMEGEPITLYAVFSKAVTLTYYDSNSTAQYRNDTRYYNNGVENNPSFVMSQSDNGWTKRGWSKTDRADASIDYANGATITLTDNMTIYGMYQTSYTLSYSGNGANSGSVSSETKTAYFSAPAGAIYPTFTLKANGFTRNGYTFNGWDLGAVGAKVTLSANKTATAKWTDNAWTWVNNYVGSGDALTVTITDADNVGYYYPVGDTLSEFKVTPDRDVTEQAMSIHFQTNAVNTKGCKYMNIVFDEFYTSYANDGDGSDGGNQYIQVKSSSGTTIKEIRGHKYGTTEKVDVSSASKVYLYSRMGAWGYNGTPVCKIKSISFTN